MTSPDSSRSRTKGSVGAVVKAAGGEDLRRHDRPSFVVMGVGRFAPDAGEPRLLFERQASGAVKMGELDESHGGQVTPPAFEIVEDAVAPAIPSLLVVAARFRGEQHAARWPRYPRPRVSPSHSMTRDMA